MKAQQTSDQATATLKLRIEALTSDIAARDREKSADAAARHKLEKELDDLRKVMAAKSSEDIKRQEADKSREAEMTRLRESAALAQKALEDQREQSQQLSNKLRVDFEGIMSSYKAADKELKGLKVVMEGKERELAGLRERMERADGERRGVEAELKRVREGLEEVERKLKGAEVNRDVSNPIGSADNSNSPKNSVGNKRNTKIWKTPFWRLKPRRLIGHVGWSPPLDSLWMNPPVDSISNNSCSHLSSNLPITGTRFPK